MHYVLAANTSQRHDGDNVIPTEPLHSAVLSDEAAATAAVLVVAVLLVALAIADLVRVVDGDANTESSWKRRIISYRDRILQAVPLTAIKIVVVSWQIVTQARRGRVCIFLDSNDRIRRNKLVVSRGSL